MSSVIVLAPIIVASWPAITAAVTAAIGTMGFTIARGAMPESTLNTDEMTRAEIEVEDSDILQDAAGTSQELVVEKDGIRAIFRATRAAPLKYVWKEPAIPKASSRRSARSCWAGSRSNTSIIGS